jgi:hypothetical protein
MAQFTIYKATDASAPVLSGEAGKLTDLLTAVLVDGYGAKAAAGWTREFTGTNKAVYRPGAGARHFYQVLDDASVAFGTVGAPESYKSASLSGYESMSSVDTGSRKFPDTTQFLVRKSNALSAAPIDWIMFADSATAYLFIYAPISAAVYETVVMGDFTSYVVGDSYNSIVAGLPNVPGAGIAVTSQGYGVFYMTGSNLLTATDGTNRAIPRGWTQLGVPPLVACSMPINGTYRDTETYAPQGAANPYPSAGSLVTIPIELRERISASEAIVRGRFRGLRAWGHAFALLSDRGIYSSTDGKSFMAIRNINAFNGTNPNPGGVLIEISNTL